MLFYVWRRGEDDGKEETKGIWKDVVDTTNEYFDGGTKKTWVGMRGIMGKRAGGTDKGKGTLRPSKGRIVSGSKERERQ